MPPSKKYLWNVHEQKKLMHMLPFVGTGCCTQELLLPDHTSSSCAGSDHSVVWNFSFRHVGLRCWKMLWYEYPKLLTEGIDSVILIMLFTILHSLLSSTFGIIQLLWSIILTVPSFGWCGGDLFRTQLHPDEWQRQSMGSQDAYVAALYREMNLLINFVLFN